MINTYPLTPGFTPPPEAYYRLAARNGMFFHRETWFCNATVFEHPLATPNNYEECEEHASCRLDKIPAVLVQEVHRFFFKVYREYHAEAYLRLYANPETGEWRLVAPPQVNHSCSVVADATLAPEGFFEVGSIHPHPGSAFHSATDVADECAGDGLHIILGHLDRFVPEIVAVLAVRGRRFTINPADILEFPWEYEGPWLAAINKGRR